MQKISTCKLYILAFYDPEGISTISEQLSSISEYSKFDVEIINLHRTYPSRGMVIPEGRRFQPNASVLIHPTVAYFPDNLKVLCESLRQASHRVIGPTILYKQDEHVRSHETAKIIGEYGIDILLTCLDAYEVEKAYPKALTGNIHTVNVLTGYVSDLMKSQLPTKDWNERSVDIFYRGSKQPAELGELGFIKYAMADRLNNWSKSHQGYNVDASSEWSARLNGFDWYDRLCDSKVVIGTVSGSNCFDFDGSLKEKVDHYLNENPEIDPWTYDGYLRLCEEVLNRYEGNVNYGQLAPRHLEAAAARCPQLLIRGEYNGLFIEGRHYLELEPDLSNLDDLMAKLSDSDFRNQLVDQAYNEIVLNPEVHNSAFVRKLDKSIDQYLYSCGQSTDSSEMSAGAQPRVLVICPHDAQLDPRIEWWHKKTSECWDVCLLDVMVQDPDGVFNGRHTVKHHSHDLSFSAKLESEFSHANVDELFEGSGFEGGSASKVIFKDVCEYYLEEVKGQQVGYLSDHVWLVGHMLRTSFCLSRSGRLLGGMDCILAADLPSLLAGLYLKGFFGCPLVYDAQEIWAHSCNGLTEAETEWWTELENRLLAEIDIPLTVSPGLVEYYKETANCEFLSVPNFIPLSDCRDADSIRSELEGPVRFVFLGNFATNRGIKELIEAWDFLPEVATLALIGPDNPFKEECEAYARSLGRGKRGVSFLAPVSEDELIDTAKSYDVGVIPYMYSYPYNQCSPNKMSQYMAAGCVILHHSDLSFVSQNVSKAGCGYSADFGNVSELRSTVNKLLSQKDELDLMKRKAVEYATTDANWSAATSEMVIAVKDAVNCYRAAKRWDIKLLSIEGGGYKNSIPSIPSTVERFRNLNALYPIMARKIAQWLSPFPKVYAVARLIHQAIYKMLCKIIG